jgi:hypothetical protein
MSTIILVLLGFALLFAGRRLFWLFVGAVGFVVGFALATQFLQSQSDLLKLAIALGVGFLCAVLAGFLQHLAIAVAGFVAGGYGLIVLLDMLGLKLGFPTWAPFLLGGIIGTILIAVLFEWALIILSSLIGAELVLQAIPLEQAIAVLVFAVLFFIGVAVQAGTRPRKKTKPVV